ncbi:hypothetical protein HNY73_013051 [Argiope bruennichi]|uniref:Uncharacterized protein n=1 Tax=Argiope bruennichi TaxID=94029 RepID=A0A8T0EWU9_ARGBR|nr:hypothetical protein HNY73_013051 [Argiope bruennichi]
MRREKKVYAQGGIYGETPCSKGRKKLTQVILLRAVERRAWENSRQTEMEQRINMNICYKFGEKDYCCVSNMFAHSCARLVSGVCRMTTPFPMARCHVTILAHPPYSPDMASADFFLFRRLKVNLKYTRFVDISDIRRRVTSVLHSIPKETFVDSFQQLYQ